MHFLRKVCRFHPAGEKHHPAVGHEFRNASADVYAVRVRHENASYKNVRGEFRGEPNGLSSTVGWKSIKTIELENGYDCIRDDYLVVQH